MQKPGFLRAHARGSFGFLLAMIIAAGIAHAGDVFEIPKLAGISIDGKNDDWKDQGLKVDGLKDEKGAAFPAENLTAGFRLGWDERGILVFVTVVDDTALEGEKNDELWRADSVEFFAASEIGGDNFFQIIVSPGRDEKHAQLRKQLGDHRKEKKGALSIDCVSTKTANGYVMEALLPWSNLNRQWQNLDELGFQLYVNDADSPGQRQQAVWFPAGNTGANSRSMQRIKLAGKPANANAGHTGAADNSGSTDTAQARLSLEDQLAEERKKWKAIQNPATPDAENAIQKFKLAAGLKCELFAAEPHVANIVGMNFDEKGRLFVSETHRAGNGVLDNRSFGGKTEWLDEDLACRTVEDRIALLKRWKGKDTAKLGAASERVRLLEDRDGDGKVETSSVFAEGFNAIEDGLAAGVLPYKGNVYFADIPNLWLLKDSKNEGKADFRKSLHYGFGVRVAFLGHDLHGLRIGPDGRLYFSIGDRGANVKTPEGYHLRLEDMGGVFRCNLDGSELELFATGLRNPQGLCFDQYGNLFTGDNNSDSGDKARWVYIVEGSDNGWRVGYQLIEKPSRGPFNAEKIWHLQNPEQPANIVPPVAHITNGPSGTAYYPGTGLPDKYKEHFFLCDFTGGAGAGVFSFSLKPKGATYEMTDVDHIIKEILPTDVAFAPGGGLYVGDWVEGWVIKGQGRVYRVHDPEVSKSTLVQETKKLINEGMDQRTPNELKSLLAHPDIRVRQEAQFALVTKGPTGMAELWDAAKKNESQLARLHAIWGLEMMARKWGHEALAPLLPLFTDSDAEVRAQCAKLAGERRERRFVPELIKLLKDDAPRARFFAAIALGRIGKPEAVPAILDMLRENADKDAYLRHAGVMGLAGCADVDSLARLATHESASVRMGALLALRRLERAEISVFLRDKEPTLVLEAARAINDIPLNGAMSDLAALLDVPTNSEPLLRRTINANFRWGSAEAAARLVKFAAREGGPELMRGEAMTALADWASPSGRDRVTGLWRPLVGLRDTKVALEAFKPVLAGIMKSAPNSVRAIAAQAAEKLGIADAGAIFFPLIADVNAPLNVRIEALKTLVGRNDPKLSEAIKIGLRDNSSSLRREAAALLAKANPADAVDYLKNQLETGLISDKQAALATLANLQAPGVDELLAQWMDKLLAGTVYKETQLDILEAAAKHQTDAIKEKLKAFEDKRDKADPLGKFREVLHGGNASIGRKIFFEKQEVSCLKCHKVNGKGGDVAPELKGIGSKQPREYFLESILFPNKVIAQGYESNTVKLKSGKVIVGMVKDEKESELTLVTNDGPVVVKKDDIQTRKGGQSAMPDDIAERLTKQDLRNLISFLAGLQ
jgi:quinoprotein glucose dehydrogenase